MIKFILTEEKKLINRPYNISLEYERNKYALDHTKINFSYIDEEGKEQTIESNPSLYVGSHIGPDIMVMYPIFVDSLGDTIVYHGDKLKFDSDDILQYGPERYAIILSRPFKLAFTNDDQISVEKIPKEERKISSKLAKENFKKGNFKIVGNLFYDSVIDNSSSE